MNDRPEIVDEPDEDAWERAALRLDAVDDLLNAADLERAEQVASASIEELTRVVGREHPDTGNAHDRLGVVLLALGRPSDALASFRAAVAVLERWRDEPAVHPMRAVALGNLSYALTQLGHYDEAKRRQHEVIELTASVHGDDAREVALAWNGMGVCLKMQGELEDASAAYARATAIWHQAGEPLPATLLHNLAGLAVARGDGALAERHARAAIERRPLEDDDVFALGTDVAGLGDALLIQGRAALAEAAFSEALEHLRSRPEHPEVGYALHNLGDALAAQGRFPDAKRAYEEAIAHKSAALGVDHFEVAASEANLAALLAEHGAIAEARAYVTAAQKRAAALPETHPIRTAIESLAADLA